jgi:hypothetical protein
MMKRAIKLLSVLGIVAAIVLAACEKISSTGDPSDIDRSGPGTLILNITDDPFPVDMIDSAIVTIVKVEIRNMDVDTAYPFFTVMEDTSLTFNLLELRNGVTAQMIETEIPAGNYDLIRLYVDRASLTVKDGDTYKLKVPSGSSTGIKVFLDPAVSISGGTITELLLDFSLEKSFILKGNMNSPAGIKGFNFKPVIRAVNQVTAGMVNGMVSDTSGMMVAGAEVWIEQDSLVATAYTDTLGYYGFAGIPAGIYDMYATGEDYDTASAMGIEVVAGAMIQEDFVLTMQNDTAQ